MAPDRGSAHALTPNDNYLGRVLFQYINKLLFQVALRDHACDYSSRGRRHQSAHANRNQTHGLQPLAMSDRHCAFAHKAALDNVAQAREFRRCQIRTSGEVIHLSSGGARKARNERRARDRDRHTGRPGDRRDLGVELVGERLDEAGAKTALYRAVVLAIADAVVSHRKTPSLVVDFIADEHDSTWRLSWKGIFQRINYQFRDDQAEAHGIP